MLHKTAVDMPVVDGFVVAHPYLFESFIWNSDSNDCLVLCYKSPFKDGAKSCDFL